MPKANIASMFFGATATWSFSDSRRKRRIGVTKRAAFRTQRTGGGDLGEPLPKSDGRVDLPLICWPLISHLLLQDLFTQSIIDRFQPFFVIRASILFWEKKRAEGTPSARVNYLRFIYFCRM
jgi:hypothetical protein